jgi:hypothetical protein
MQNPGCAEWRDGLDSFSLTHFSQSPLIVHVERMCAIYPSVLTSINMRFCSITVVIDDETRKTREHRRFWNMRTAKKETEDDAMAHAYNSLFLATPTLWSTTIIQRARFFFAFVL